MKTKNKFMKTSKIILKSCNPSEYPDLEITCKELENGEIGEYLSAIPEEKKVMAYKSVPVSARIGTPGEVIRSVLTTMYEGREYILGEEEATVKEREGQRDIVVTNVNSTSNESYVVKASKFATTYEPGENGQYVPVREPRLLTEVPENIVITTAWGSKAICLKGSYIVTYNAEQNDYNTLERGAKEATYTECEKLTEEKKLIKQ